MIMQLFFAILILFFILGNLDNFNQKKKYNGKLEGKIGSILFSIVFLFGPYLIVYLS